MARDDVLGQFEGTGVEIAGLNCNGNPLHSTAAIGNAHADDIRRSIRLSEPARAAPRGHHVRPAGRRAGARRPNWIVKAWNSAALDVLEHQWGVAETFWR
jgi:sugar phosphate isomerase/epimerase